MPMTDAEQSIFQWHKTESRRLNRNLVLSILAVLVVFLGATAGLGMVLKSALDEVKNQPECICS